MPSKIGPIAAAKPANTTRTVFVVGDKLLKNPITFSITPFKALKAGAKVVPIEIARLFAATFVRSISRPKDLSISAAACAAAPAELACLSSSAVNFAAPVPAKTFAAATASVDPSKVWSSPLLPLLAFLTASKAKPRPFFSMATWAV